MKPYFLLIALILPVHGNSASKQQAELLIQRDEFKKALAAYLELADENPREITSAIKVAELKLLLEGRSSAIDYLKTRLKKQRRYLSMDQQQEISKKTKDFSQVFISEEAQTHYLQALAKTKLQEWTAALPPITQAAALEPGNLYVLNLKSEIERQLEMYDAAYATLKELAQLDPQTDKLVERLAEAHIYHKNFKEAVAVIEDSSAGTISSRAKIALAVSQWELGKKDTSKKLLEELTRQKKSEWAQHPVTLWLQYRIEADDSTPSEANNNLKGFLKSASEKSKVLIEGWDPYQLALQAKNLAK